jgi:hypothetical protein
MTFTEWTREEQHSTQTAVSLKTMKTRQERDRLNRMEAMLDELVVLKRIIVEAKTFQTPENSHAKE